MKHLHDGELRAALDGELAPTRAQHLQDCPTCRTRLALLREQNLALQRRLSFLAPPSSPSGPDAQRALIHFKTLLKQQKEKSMFQKLFASRITRFGLAAALLLGLVLSVPSTRAWAGEFLGLFRVKQVMVLPIDTTGIDQLNGNSSLSKQISQMFSKSVTVTQEPGKPKAAADAAEASQMAGFSVRLPQAAPSTPRLTVNGAAAFDMVADRAKAQTLLDEAGRTDLVLPQTLDGAKIAVSVPSSVTASFGTCPDPTQAELPGKPGSNGRRYPDCILLAEIPSPTVNTPPNVDVQQLAEIALEFTGMTKEQAQAFSKNVDWTSSLVIPIPKNAATYKEVSVDGVTGTLIERPADDAPEFMLIWVKDGIVYTIGGLGSHADQAIQMANSLQ